MKKKNQEKKNQEKKDPTQPSSNTSEGSSTGEKTEPLKKPVFTDKPEPEKKKGRGGAKLEKQIEESISVVTPIIDTIIAFAKSEPLTENERKGFNSSLYLTCKYYGYAFLPQITLFMWSVEIIASRIIDKVYQKQLAKGKQEQDTKADFERKVKQAKTEGIKIETEEEELNRIRTNTNQ